METSIKTIILSAAVIFAAMSCQKEESVPGTQDQVKAGETIQVNIDACLGDLAAADGTKATAESVVRLTWTAGDKVAAYCGTTKISTDSLTVTPSENKLFARLSGTIDASSLTSGTSVITFVYSSGCKAEGLEFDFSSQNDSIPFVAYGTLVYDGTATLTDKMVEFKFATSVMKIAATNLGGEKIDSATISGINTKVTLTPKAESETCGIAGSEPASIATDNFGFSSDGTRAIVTVGLVPDNTSNPYRMLTVRQPKYINKGVITSDEIEKNTSYTTPAALFTCGTLGSGATAHDYVLIAGTKWATQNLAVSESGKKQWKAVNLPGTTSPVQIGDYFQWGASYKGYSITEVDDQKPDTLLIYSSFVNTGTDSGNSFSFKDSYSFNSPSSSPYYSDDYTRYTTEDGIVTLTPSDDVASILWSGTWRMPTLSEFKALKKATYWKWDDTDKGYYVYAPKSGDANKVNNATGTYDKSGALLFFPAAGYGGASLSHAGVCGGYWSSSLYTGTPGWGYRLSFDSGSVNLPDFSCRYGGYSVRPVSE